VSGFTVTPAPANSPSGRRLYSPPQFGSGKSNYSMTCTLPANPGFSDEPESGTGTPDLAAMPSPTTYFFQLVGRVEHIQEQTITKHPVQIGPAIVDHAYNQPARVVMEVVASDCAATLVAGQYSSKPSQSVSMYQTFKQIQAARVPITLATRLDQYQNMALTDVRATEDSRSTFGFRGVLYFEQIVLATVSGAPAASDRPNQTGSTPEGTKGSSPLSSTETQQLNDIMQAFPTQPFTP
jgi:hypothetical protein